MTRKRRTTPTRQTEKEVLQFAPNFTVYVLPHNSVCLYSEDRKFFLHGELYCALASAIARGGQTFGSLVHELAAKFPPAKIEEALARLIERRHLVKSRSPLRTADAYWASLGMPIEMAHANLGKCRLGIVSLDVQGAAELEAALSELGARVAKRSADLTITLVNDYLDARLDELNRRHLADKSRWLLAQPAGIFPLVGPIFEPDKSACCNPGNLCRPG